MKKKSVVEQVLDFIFRSKPENFRFISAGWLAREFGVTVPYLSSAFKKKYGMGLSDVLVRLKARHGAELLINRKNLTIKQVSEMLGFSDIHGFIKMFKRFYGLTPETYRSWSEKG
ncbi:MAG: AraC family transcriptional regulator [bacterium]|nr:AraC family transcriptional regulator [bacterium]